MFASRYAGAMLLHASFAQADAGTVLAAAAGGGRRPANVTLLSAVGMCFALGADAVEQFKHLAAADAGPLAGLGTLPGLRALRPHLARIADAADLVRIQAMFASAMLAADPVTSGVCYVDDHFIPYTGAKPVAKGWNNKRGRAERGHADTHVTAYDGRAVCFVTGEPSGLSTTLARALAELKKAAGPRAKIMLGFDRGGAYPQVFTHCREQQVHWVTYRRAPLAVPVMLPVITTITAGGRTRQITWAGETVQLKDYGQARQITLFEHGKVALQILTSDFDACPAEILSWLKSRWREENSGSGLERFGGLFGTVVSAAFLLLIGLLNLVVLAGIVRVFASMRRGEYDEAELERQLANRGFFYRFFGRWMKVITKEWQLYPVGVVFGLGFDTATEVALLATTALLASQHIPWYAIICLPVLFTAGMTFMDTTDGLFMNLAYGWAFLNPVRKVYYNLAITGLSVAICFVIGAVEALSLLPNEIHGLSRTTGFWGLISRFNINTAGLVIVGLFLATWLVALLIWRYARIEEKWNPAPSPARPAAPRD